MAESCLATVRIATNARPDAVRTALTDPALIAQYVFGSEVVVDWQVGGPGRIDARCAP